MEKDVALGSVGGIKLSLAGGKATIAIEAGETVAGGAVVAQAQASATVDASHLLDLLFAEIEAKSPAGAAPIEEAVKNIIKSAVAAI